MFVACYGGFESLNHRGNKLNKVVELVETTLSPSTGTLHNIVMKMHLSHYKHSLSEHLYPL